MKAFLHTQQVFEPPRLVLALLYRFTLAVLQKRFNIRSAGKQPTGGAYDERGSTDPILQPLEQTQVVISDKQLMPSGRQLGWARRRLA